MKKILVVEDDRFLANAYEVKLLKSGYDVKITYDGEEAMIALQSFIPDLIILDLMMPGIDGFSILSQLKTSDKLKHIPVIVSSNLGQPEEVKKAMNLGANDYIIKTDQTMKKLIDKIDHYLQSGSS